jgi:hypothetical protein
MTSRVVGNVILLLHLSQLPSNNRAAASARAKHSSSIRTHGVLLGLEYFKHTAQQDDRMTGRENIE